MPQSSDPFGKERDPYGKERVKTKQNQNLRPLALGHLVVPRTSMGRSIGLGCATSSLNHDCSCLSPLRDFLFLHRLNIVLYCIVSSFNTLSTNRNSSSCFIQWGIILDRDNLSPRPLLFRGNTLHIFRDIGIET